MEYYDAWYALCMSYKVLKLLKTFISLYSFDYLHSIHYKNIWSEIYFFLISLCLPENFELRSDLATGSNLSDFRSTVLQLRDRYLPFHEGTKTWPGDTGM